MSFGHQPPPPKTTGTGTIIGILALIFVGLPSLLCLIGGVALWGVAGFPGIGASKNEFPDVAGSNEGISEGFANKEEAARAAWQRVIEKKRSVEVEFGKSYREYRLGLASGNRDSDKHKQAYENWSQGYEQVKKMVLQTEQAHGPIPPDLVYHFKLTERDMLRELIPVGMPLALIEAPRPHSQDNDSAVVDQRIAKRKADSEQQLASMRAELAQRNAQGLAESQRLQQLAAQRLAEQQAAAREQQAREQRQREFANIVPQPQPQPQPFVPPPVFNNPPPVVNNPPPAVPQPQANEPPGYPAPDIAQLKLKDLVFVQVADKWHPAFVQQKRGVLITVRSTETGAVQQVTIERIRMQNEPATQPSSNVPPALRAVTAPKKTGGNNEEEDDALFTAKPGDETARATTPATPSPGGPAAPAKAAAPVAEFRTWTDDTGKFKIEAELVNFEFDLVTLRRRDGKVISMRMDKLSTDDQAIIRQKFQ